MSFMFNPHPYDDPKPVNKPVLDPGIEKGIVFSYKSAMEKIASLLSASSGVFAIDGCPSAEFDRLETSVRELAAAKGNTVEFIHISGIYKTSSELDSQFEENLPEDRVKDPVLLYGKLYNVLTYLPEGAEDWEAVDYPFSFTADGISLYEPVEVAGETFQDFVFEDDGSLVALDETGEKTSVKVTASQADTYVPYEDFEGNYIFGFMDVDGDGSITNYPVTLELNEDGYSYTMPFAGFDISVGWTPYGYMTFNTQYLGLYQDLFVMMCPLSSSGFFSVSSETGYNIVPDMSGDGQVWMFEDNGAWDEIMCMMLYGFFDQQLNEQAGYLMRFIPGYLIKQ